MPRLRTYSANSARTISQDGRPQAKHTPIRPIRPMTLSAQACQPMYEASAAPPQMEPMMVVIRATCHS